LELTFLVVLLNFIFLQRKIAQQKEQNVYRNTSDYIEATHIVPRLKSRFAKNQYKSNKRTKKLSFVLVMLNFKVNWTNT